MHPALLYRPGDRLSLPELSAARIDGHVIEVGAAYMPADTTEGADARAASIAWEIPTRVGASGPTAAWIHGAGSLPPTTHHVRRTVSARFRPHATALLILHEPEFADEDMTEIGGLMVGTPLFTGTELALGAAAQPDYARWLSRLLGAMPELGEELLHRVDRLHRRPGRTQARSLLRTLVGS